MRKCEEDPTRRQKDRTQWGASAINQILLRIEKQYFGARQFGAEAGHKAKQRKQICLFARPRYLQPSCPPPTPFLLGAGGIPGHRLVHKVNPVWGWT